MEKNNTQVFWATPMTVITDTLKKQWHPYVFDCSKEYDEKGELCKDWTRGGLCEKHRATMFLFCRKTCLCTGPPKQKK
ncbi:unnamed protein product [Dracunculus medinensis]|uniref:ShKT domain-containing protein n=1 Tax=Dracunculus medinensis TaxID=318479 RepID=A0A0N4UJ16_DRAME|nr:unnamed protein product [Dracunculus medinensis]